MIKRFGLSGNTLKVIGAISMFIDHLGYSLFPNLEILRIIGRLAFPIFSFMICEGCRHTRNKFKYLAQVLLLGIICTAVYYFVDNEWYFNVLITFSLSIILIYIAQFIAENKDITMKCVGIIFGGLLVVLLYNLPAKYQPDYGFWGVMLPVLPAVLSLMIKPNDKYILALQPRFWVFTVGLTLLNVFQHNWGYYSLLALAFLALYNGKKGFYLPKYFFYVFYPAHLVFVWLLTLLIR